MPDLVARARTTADRLQFDDYRGHDPFDTLASPLFRAPVLRSARLPRFAAQQIGRRMPFNLRPLLRVPKGRNPVTLALALQAHAHLHRAQPVAAVHHRARAEALVADLDAVRSRGWSGDCWGYDFDWEARYMRLPAWTPTIVATGIVTNALYTAHRILGIDRAIEMCASATRFVLEDLQRTPGAGGAFCWSYSPVAIDTVLNATAKGARLCAQVHAITGELALAEAAAASARFVVDHQAASGAWPYAVGDARRWADNFHTAYVLDCLTAVGRLTPGAAVEDAVSRGWTYYRERFFTPGLVPKYFDDRVLPIDATACAQSIITLCRFGDREAAAAVVAFADARLRLPDGAYAYQVRRRTTVRTPFARWSTAWMLLALAVLADERDQP